VSKQESVLICGHLSVPIFETQFVKILSNIVGIHKLSDSVSMKYFYQSITMSGISQAIFLPYINILRHCQSFARPLGQRGEMEHF